MSMRRLDFRNKWLLVQFAAMMHPELSSTALRVFIRLLDHRNAADGRCFPSHAKLVAAVTRSRRSVQKSIRALERAGLIAVQTQKARSGANAYSFPKWQEKVCHLERVLAGLRFPDSDWDDPEEGGEAA